MGICWGAPSNQTTPNDATIPPRSITGDKSQTITRPASPVTRHFSKNSPLSASSGDDEAGSGRISAAPNLRIFSYSELKVATRNFRPDTVLGEGGFGKVYKGWLDDRGGAVSKSSNGSVVAIKKMDSESMQGFEEWLSEIQFLGRLSHPNLVKLVGYCWEDEELLLVYEFMQKGSLENHLFGRGSSVQPLPWHLRLKIAIGAARGLVFLHASDKKVIYRDFKASNILIDGFYTAKISDFGLAKLGPTASRSHVTTRIIGTYGYAAPEYVLTGHLYVKSDVYGFGVVLLELLTGLRAVDLNRPPGRQNMPDWIKPYLSDKRKLKSMVDSRFEGNYPFRAAMQFAQLALRCLAPEPKFRPPMKEVLETLEAIEASGDRLRRPRTRPSAHPATLPSGHPPSRERRRSSEAGGRTPQHPHQRSGRPS